MRFGGKYCMYTSLIFTIKYVCKWTYFKVWNLSNLSYSNLHSYLKYKSFIKYERLKWIFLLHFLNKFHQDYWGWLTDVSVDVHHFQLRSGSCISCWVSVWKYPVQCLTHFEHLNVNWIFSPESWPGLVFSGFRRWYWRTVGYRSAEWT